VISQRSLIGRAFDAVMPGLAIKRERLAAIRDARELIRAEYAGASRRRRDGGWYTPSTSANVEIKSSLVALRDRARNLVRDNPFAERIITVWVAHQVGDGITAEPRSGDKALDDTLRDAWRAFADDGECDADGLNDFYGLQSLIGAALVTDGEVLVRKRTRLLSDGFRVPLQLQVLEADHLDHTKNAILDNGRTIVMGVQFDPIGRREGYWLFRNHPGDGFFGFSRESVFVPADQIMHIFRRRRPGQVRGVTWLHAVLNAMRDLDDTWDALRLKAKIEACLAIFIKGGEPESTLGNTSTATRSDGTSKRLEEIEPGMIEYLDGGEGIETVNPSTIGNHEVVTSQTLHAIAAGAGITHDQLTGDLSGANYSSLVAGKIEFRRDLSQIQWQLFIPMLCEPTWNAWRDLGAAAGRWPRGDWRAEWMPPRNEPIDRKKDTDAEQADVERGFQSWSQVVRKRGVDPRRLAEEIQADDEMLSELGLQRLIVTPGNNANPTPDPTVMDNAAA
jgi:lambda family phage portal protein